MPVARMAIEPEALIGVSGKLNITGSPGFAVTADPAIDVAPCVEF